MYTTSKEDYLRALYIVEEEKHELKSSDVARYLDVSKPSVSEMVRQLSREGLITYKRYSKLRFTPKGLKEAKKLTSRHRLIERFLKDVLKISPRHIHQEAHSLEHAFSDDSIAKLRRFLGNPKVDPHGKPIPQ